MGLTKLEELFEKVAKEKVGPCSFIKIIQIELENNNFFWWDKKELQIYVN